MLYPVSLIHLNGPRHRATEALKRRKLLGTSAVLSKRQRLRLLEI